MISSYTFQDTTDKNIKRFVDRKGNWTHYYIISDKKFVPAVNHVLGLGYNKGPRFNEYLLNARPEEARKKLETAGEEGSRTHAAIRDIARGVKVDLKTSYLNDLTGRQEMLNPDEWDNLLAYMRFVECYKPHIIADEFAVYSPKGKYAGTADILVTLEVPKGDKFFPKTVHDKRILVLVDWKTSSRVWNEYRAQLASYRHAMVEREQFKKFYKSFKGMDFIAVVRLGTNHKIGYEVVVWSGKEAEKTYKDKFRSAYEIYLEHEPVFEPRVEEIPTELYQPLPVAKIKKHKKK